VTSFLQLSDIKDYDDDDGDGDDE